MTSLVVQLLAQRPEEELQKLRDTASAELARLEVEIEQLDEALGKKTRRRSSRQTTRSRASRSKGNTKKLVEGMFRANPGEIFTPAGVRDALEDQGTPPSSSSAVYNAFGRLKQAGVIVPLGEGEYQLASRNGEGAESGTKHEDGTPLSAGSSSEGP
jgi:hypothetical protein